jgi:hypothetical protein
LRIADLKRKGDVAEMMVAADLCRRGHRVCVPWGEDCDYDLIAERPDGRFERVQVKYTTSNGEFIEVRCNSHSITKGRVRASKNYTSAVIDWLAVYDATTNCCYYVPAAALGEGRWRLHLRLVPARSGRRAGIRLATDYLSF